MTANAINAMRLQEEKRHNAATEQEAADTRKSNYQSSLIGSAIRGLGTGILSNVQPMTTAFRTLSTILNRRRRGE